ncbi:MAG: hypothetical protein IT521_05145 [Burkholderiales bacterium]|nr:hypothetical protein [Burkholderiales bacterium]
MYPLREVRDAAVDLVPASVLFAVALSARAPAVCYYTADHYQSFARIRE